MRARLTLAPFFDQHQENAHNLRVELDAGLIANIGQRIDTMHCPNSFFEEVYNDIFREGVSDRLHAVFRCNESAPHRGRREDAEEGMWFADIIRRSDERCVAACRESP